MTVSDQNGSIVFQNTSKCDFGDMPSRVSRTKLLNGEVYIGHYGVCAGDRTFYLDLKVTKAEADRVRYIHTNSRYLLFGINEGLFYGVISEFGDKNGMVKATILIKNKEN